MTQLPDETEIRTAPCPNCIVCDEAGALVYAEQRDRLFGASGSWSFKKCANRDCGVIWLDPMPVKEDLWKAYANYYTHAPQGGVCRAGMLKRFYRLMKRGYLADKYGYRTEQWPMLIKSLGKLLYLFPAHRSDVDTWVRFLHAVPDGKLLDVGCGSGEWLAFMRELGWQVEGVDFDQNAVKVARQGGLKVFEGTLVDQKFPADMYDAVTLNHVIEHVPDPVEVLKECLRILKPGGTLALATPNSRSWGHRVFKEHWRGLEPPRHLHLMSPRAMQRVLMEVGFAEVSVRTHNTYYILYHSYRLWATRQHDRGHGKFRHPHPLLPGAMTTLEQIMLVIDPACGECIGAVAVKK